MAQQPPYQPVEPPPYPEQSYSPRSKGEPDVPAPGKVSEKFLSSLNDEITRTFSLFQTHMT